MLAVKGADEEPNDLSRRSDLWYVDLSGWGFKGRGCMGFA